MTGDVILSYIQLPVYESVSRETHDRGVFLRPSRVTLRYNKQQSILVSIKHLYNMCTMSKTLGRRCTNTIQMLCVFWDYLQKGPPSFLYSKHTTFV